MSDIIQFNYKDHWKEEEINLERTNSDDKLLGFTITGGVDRPFVNHHFTSIIVTRITENSLVHRNKQLKLYDIILRVNNVNFTNIKHEEAINVLRRSGDKVKLLIRRLSPSNSEEIELEHNRKLGIAISGGIGNEYFQNDHGIFITNTDKYQTNKQLDIGDRLLQVSSTYNTYDLRFVTFETAEKYIQLACKESRKIKLYVGHTRPTEGVESKKPVLHQGQYDTFGSNDEVCVQFNNNTYSTIFHKSENIKPEHHYESEETINKILNERHTKNRNDDQLIMLFDFDDYQRYENRAIVRNHSLIHNRSINNSREFLLNEKEQPTTTKSAIPPPVIHLSADRQVSIGSKRFKVNDTNRNAADKQRTTQELKLNKAAIDEARAEKLRREQSKISQRARMNSGLTTSGTNGGLRWQVN